MLMIERVAACCVSKHRPSPLMDVPLMPYPRMLWLGFVGVVRRLRACAALVSWAGECVVVIGVAALDRE